MMIDRLQRALEHIEELRADEQEALAEQIERYQRRLPRSESPAASAPSSWDALYGLATTDHQPPSDEQVAEWLDERRMEKYGK